MIVFTNITCIFTSTRQFSKEYKQKYKVCTGNIAQARGIMDKTTLIEDNFVKITSSLRSMDASVMEDKPLWTLTTLMSQIGGVLNLYSGISLIVVVECMELMYNLLTLPYRPRERIDGEDTSSSKENTTDMFNMV